MGHSFHDAHELGWKIEATTLNHDWSKLVETVTNHVRSLNFSYRVGLTKNKGKSNLMNALYSTLTSVYFTIHRYMYWQCDSILSSIINHKH